MNDLNPLLEKIISLYKGLYGQIEQFSNEKESGEYGACRFEINGLRVISRNAKITPNKVGLFVTIWKRMTTGPIAPFDESDPVDVVIINVQEQDCLGQFVFPKSVLCQKGIFSTTGRSGKRGIRVYPFWSNPSSSQAIQTQKWQLKYFQSLKESEKPKSHHPLTK